MASDHTAVDLTSASVTQDMKGLKLDGQVCSVCKESISSETEYLFGQKEIQGCERCGFTVCHMCTSYFLGGKPIECCLQCQAPYQSPPWYEIISPDVNGEETEDSFKYCYLLPNKQAREYFFSTLTIGLQDFSRQDKNYFYCALCRTRNLAFSEF